MICMTEEEHTACASLCLHKKSVYINNHDNMTKTNLSYEERINSYKNKKTIDNFEYGNCDFILGSAPVLEHLWSIAELLLAGNRGRTLPLLMEAIFF